MTTVTIRAADSAEALEEVMRRLGPDALILSTRQNRGMVEIVAGSAEFRMTPATADSGPRLVPSPAATMPARFQTELTRAMARPDDAAAILPPHLSGRVILVGPPGAGRSLLAARLAAAALRDTKSPRPVLVAPRPDLLTGPGPLAGWARLLGLTLHRPVWAHGLPARLSVPDPATLEILDLSDMPAPAPDTLGPLAKLSDSQVWLVLPTALHPSLHARVCPPWAGIARLIALTRADLCPPTPEDHALHQSTGIAPALLADGAGLLDVLHPLAPDRDEGAAPPPSEPLDACASLTLDDHPCEDPSDAAAHLS